MSAAELSRAVDLLVGQSGHWVPARWAAPAGGAASRGDLVYLLVQRIADLAADAEGQPRRPVPRLANDTALTDQLRVVTADLLAANPAPAVLAQAASDVLAVRGLLGDHGVGGS